MDDRKMYYHATPAKNLASILEKGLIPDHRNYDNPVIQGAVSFSSWRAQAIDYAHRFAKEGDLVLIVAEFDEHEIVHEFGPTSPEVAFVGVVPPTRFLGYEYLCRREKRRGVRYTRDKSRSTWVQATAALTEFGDMKEEMPDD